MREVTLKKCNCPHYCPQIINGFRNDLLTSSQIVSYPFILGEASDVKEDISCVSAGYTAQIYR